MTLGALAQKIIVKNIHICITGECQVLCFSGLIFLEPQVG
jgi:hypothetical protein